LTPHWLSAEHWQLWLLPLPLPLPLPFELHVPIEHV